LPLQARHLLAHSLVELVETSAARAGTVLLGPGYDAGYRVAAAGCRDSAARNVDYDHPTPHDATGPPGQTGTRNSGPLGRRHHRYKTHAGYRSRQCGAGRYVWLTPHGLGFLVDARGTRRISHKHARMILDAPPGVDIYPV
jgi:hypothetical protein